MRKELLEGHTANGSASLACSLAGTDYDDAVARLHQPLRRRVELAVSCSLVLEANHDGICSAAASAAGGGPGALALSCLQAAVVMLFARHTLDWPLGEWLLM